MKISRRQAIMGIVVTGTTFSLQAGAQAPWHEIRGDDGRPVDNMRLPVELTTELDELEGMVKAGSATPDATIVEFFDYNCPYCRKAAGDVHALVGANPGLRVGLVNNPILSPRSAQAAKVELAFLTLKGPAATYTLHRKLFERGGAVDGPKALEVAEGLGASRARLEEVADGPKVRGLLSQQMRLAASLGMQATPSFVIAGTGISGYPGPKTLTRLAKAAGQCGQIAC